MSQMIATRTRLGLRAAAGDLRRQRAVVPAALAAGLVAYVYHRHALHYLVQQSAESFGPYWTHRTVLVVHIAAATAALVAGPFQLWTGFRQRWLGLHRAVGFIYLAGVVVGGFTAFWLSAVTTSPDHGVATFAFTAAWWGAVAMGLIAIRNGRTAAHRQWMIRGYVLTCGFVTLRALLDLPVWSRFGATAFPTAVWLGWVGPLLLAELGLQWRNTVHPRRRSGPAAGGSGQRISRLAVMAGNR